jgi:hypothetical protein
MYNCPWENDLVWGHETEYRVEVNWQRHRFLPRSKFAKARNLRNLRILLNSNWDGGKDAKTKESIQSHLQTANVCIVTTSTYNKTVKLF